MVDKSTKPAGGNHLPVERRVGLVKALLINLRLVWRLFRDGRVSWVNKMIIIVALLAVASPIDLLPDFIPVLGQIDDLGYLILGLALFIESCPKEVVEEHRRALSGKTSANASSPEADADVIDGEFHEVK